MLLIPDAGPLISLATLGRRHLDLLLLVEGRIVVTDRVADEVTLADFPDTSAFPPAVLKNAALIRTWLRDHAARVEEWPTAIGLQLRQQRDPAYRGPRLGRRHSGEKSVRDVLLDIKDTREPSVVLVDEKEAKEILESLKVATATILSTTEFVLALQEAGHAIDAAALIRQLRDRRPTATLDPDPAVASSIRLPRADGPAEPDDTPPPDDAPSFR